MKQLPSLSSFALAIVIGVLLVLFPSVSSAQGTIAGQITDSTGAILPGVTVEASSPALIEGSRTTTADGQGSSASTTVAVPCNNLFPAVNPCGTGGVWTAANGTFTAVNDGKSISCPSACSPAQVGTLTARFNAINDVLQLTATDTTFSSGKMTIGVWNGTAEFDDILVTDP